MSQSNSGYRVQEADGQDSNGNPIVVYKIALFEDGMPQHHKYAKEIFLTQREAEARLAEILHEERQL